MDNGADGDCTLLSLQRGRQRHGGNCSALQLRYEAANELNVAHHVHFKLVSLQLKEVGRRMVNILPALQEGSGKKNNGCFFNQHEVFLRKLTSFEQRPFVTYLLIPS